MSEQKTASLKGKWGRIGAPPKRVRWPRSIFTRERLFAFNPNQCHLTLINKVTKAVGPTNGQGEIFELTPLKQPHGSVGAPISRYVRRELFDPARMILRDKKIKRNKKVQVNTPAVATIVAPAAPPLVPIAPADLPVINPPVAS